MARSRRLHDNLQCIEERAGWLDGWMDGWRTPMLYLSGTMGMPVAPVVVN